MTTYIPHVPHRSQWACDSLPWLGCRRGLPAELFEAVEGLLAGVGVLRASVHGFPRSARSSCVSSLGLWTPCGGDLLCSQ